MSRLPILSLVTLLSGIASLGLRADVIQWANSPDLGSLSKSYDDATAEFTVDTNTNGVTFSIGHNHTTGGMDSASQWAINRWPQAPDFDPASGDFNVVTNGENAVVLGLYGFYGENGFNASTPASEITIPAIDDSVSYSLTLGFETPVVELGFQINAINALTKPTGFNSNDSLLVEAFVGGEMAAAPTYPSEGTGYVRTDNLLEGNWFNRIGLFNEPPYDVADQHVTSEGSVRVQFDGPVDLVTLTMTNVAENPIETFSPGFDDPLTPDTEERLQTWAFSVGDLTFTTIPEPSSAALILAAGLLLFLPRRRSRL